MLSRHRHRHQLRITMLAGWLFADLFLVLFMVALSAQPPVSLASHTNDLKQKHQTTRGRTNRTQPGLEQTPTDFRIYVSPAGLTNPAKQAQTASTLLREFDSKLTSLHRQGHTAGFMLVFATGAGISDAIAEANKAIDLIRKDDKDKVAFASIGHEGLWGGQANGPRDENFHFQIFFYV